MNELKCPTCGAIQGQDVIADAVKECPPGDTWDVDLCCEECGEDYIGIFFVQVQARLPFAGEPWPEAEQE
jgi:hypothetical protein